MATSKNSLVETSLPHPFGDGHQLQQRKELQLKQQPADHEDDPKDLNVIKSEVIEPTNADMNTMAGSDPVPSTNLGVEQNLEQQQEETATIGYPLGENLHFAVLTKPSPKRTVSSSLSSPKSSASLIELNLGDLKNPTGRKVLYFPPEQLIVTSFINNCGVTLFALVCQFASWTLLRRWQSGHDVEPSTRQLVPILSGLDALVELKPLTTRRLTDEDNETVKEAIVVIVSTCIPKLHQPQAGSSAAAAQQRSGRITPRIAKKPRFFHQRRVIVLPYEVGGRAGWQRQQQGEHSE